MGYFKHDCVLKIHFFCILVQVEPKIHMTLNVFYGIQ